MYTHIYIYKASQAIRMFTYKKYICPQAMPQSSVQNRLTSLYTKKGIQYTSIRVPLSHPQLLLPQEEVVAHPHLPQAVVVEHLQDPPAPAAGVH
jgi:hypothetical protein